MTNVKSVMKFAIPLLVAALSVPFSACQKHQTDQERQAEVERQVQERLAAERQQQQAAELSQREADLAAREQSLRDQQLPAATPTTTPEDRGAHEETGSSREQQPAASYSVFYDKLEPYGDWMETSDYGYVYRPREASDAQWRPYTDGRWAYTDAGWTWISDEPFGWATYHYGRWTRLRTVGWVWVPGDEWAPAWVSWRKGGQYVGWAPLPPEAQLERGTGIHNWSDNYYDVGPDQYVFVAARQIGDQRLATVIVPPQQNVTIVNQTTNVTNITYNNTTIVNQGPSYDELRAQSAEPIPRLRLERQGNVQAADPRAVVRGDVVAFPAPVFAGPRQQQGAQQRPRTVKQTIAQPAVDRGWDAIGDRQAADQARAKLKTEASPPPNAPPKRFQRDARGVSPGTASSASTSGVSPRMTQPPAAPIATATSTPPPVSARSPSPARSVDQEGIAPRAPMTPAPVASPSPAVTAPGSRPFTTPVGSMAPPRARRPAMTPLGHASAGATAAGPSPGFSAITPPQRAPMAGTAPSATPFLDPRQRRQAEQQAERNTRQQMRSAEEQQRGAEFERARARAGQETSSPKPIGAPPAATTPRPGVTTPPPSRPEPPLIPPGSSVTSPGPENSPSVPPEGMQNRQHKRLQRPEQPLRPAITPSPAP